MYIFSGFAQNFLHVKWFKVLSRVGDIEAFKKQHLSWQWHGDFIVFFPAAGQTICSAAFIEYDENNLCQHIVDHSYQARTWHVQNYKLYAMYLITIVHVVAYIIRCVYPEWYSDYMYVNGAIALLHGMDLNADGMTAYDRMAIRKCCCHMHSNSRDLPGWKSGLDRPFSFSENIYVCGCEMTMHCPSVTALLHTLGPFLSTYT